MSLQIQIEIDALRARAEAAERERDEWLARWSKADAEALKALKDCDALAEDSIANLRRAESAEAALEKARDLLQEVEHRTRPSGDMADAAVNGLARGWRIPDISPESLRTEETNPLETVCGNVGPDATEWCLAPKGHAAPHRSESGDEWPVEPVRTEGAPKQEEPRCLTHGPECSGGGMGCRDWRDEARALRAQVERLEKARASLREVIAWQGVSHDDECPSAECGDDDSCECAQRGIAERADAALAPEAPVEKETEG